MSETDWDVELDNVSAGLIRAVVSAAREKIKDDAYAAMRDAEVARKQSIEEDAPRCQRRDDNFLAEERRYHDLMLGVVADGFRAIAEAIRGRQ